MTIKKVIRSAARVLASRVREEIPRTTALRESLCLGQKQNVLTLHEVFRIPHRARPETNYN